MRSMTIWLPRLPGTENSGVAKKFNASAPAAFAWRAPDRGDGRFQTDPAVSPSEASGHCD
jgi:hypothetical protein